jgi:carbamoyltransferase
MNAHSDLFLKSKELKNFLSSKKVLAVNGCHDSSFTFIDKNGDIRIFELERFCKKRYAAFKKQAELDGANHSIDDKCRHEFLTYLKIHLNEEPEIILYSELDDYDVTFLLKYFPKARFFRMGHHMSHCAGAYFQSGFGKECLVMSLDAGGMDYQTLSEMSLRSYSVYFFSKEEFITLGHVNFGNNPFIFDPGIYGYFGHFVKEITKGNNGDPDQKSSLAYAGKIMGLSAYGKVRPEWVSPIEKFYRQHPLVHWSYQGPAVEQMSKEMGVELFTDCFSGQDSYDLAATNQHVFENLCFSLIKPYIEKYNLDLVFSGGCALNVIFNQKLKEYLESKGLKLYVPPNPNDCGLSLGHFTYYQTLEINLSPYCGFDILDRDKIPYYYQQYQDRVEYTTIPRIVDLIKNGKIGGIIAGYSEVGPRALGNRSIICDPSIPDMKDIINSKVKFREWFRPFAPVCREEDKDLYFDNAYSSEYMSFAPTVKEEYKSVFPSITHEDGTARLQTVTKEQHSLFYEILEELSNRQYPAMIMNTSFNIRGKPILTTVEDAFYVLENTELDFIVVENLLFIKK